jgi:hypothetical protein
VFVYIRVIKLLLCESNINRSKARRLWDIFDVLVLSKEIFTTKIITSIIFLFQSSRSQFSHIRDGCRFSVKFLSLNLYVRLTSFNQNVDVLRLFCGSA